MRYFTILLLLASLAFGQFELLKKDHDDCDVSRIESCREAIKIKYVNCEIYDNDSDYESDTEEEYYAEKQMDRCICNLEDDYFNKWTECAKQCGVQFDLKPEMIKSSVCSEALKINTRFASYVSSRDQAGTPAWSVTKVELDLLRTEVMSSEVSEIVAIMKSITNSNAENSSGPAASTAEESSSGTAVTVESTTPSTVASSRGAAATTESTKPSTDSSSTNVAATTESTTSTTTSSSSNIAVTVGCGSLISLVLLSLL